MAVTVPRTQRRPNGGPDREVPDRTVERRVGLPAGRAVVGALLMTAAAVGVFLAYTGATAEDTLAVVAASRDIGAGERLGPDDLVLVETDLPAASADRAFTDPSLLVGRLAINPIGEDELVWHSAVADRTDERPVRELAFSVPRSRAANGALLAGDRVDVFVTYRGFTSSVVEGARLLGAPSDAGRGDLVLRVELEDPDVVAELIHAVNTGEVTVVRSTYADEQVGATRVFTPADGTDDGGSDAGGSDAGGSDATDEATDDGGG